MKRLIVLLVGLLLLSATAPALAQSRISILSDVTVRATGQRFEGGLMLWRSDNATIYVITNQGQAYGFLSSTYARFPDNPYFSREHSLRPINGFGKIWGYYGSIRRTLGWPTQPELGFNMRIVTTGTWLYLVQKDGTIYQINRGTGAWTYASKLPTAPPPKATVTPIPPPRPTNVPQQGNAVIANFDVQPTQVNAGGTVTVYWNILGVQRAFIEAYDLGNNNAIDLRYQLAPAGSTTVTIPPNVQGDVRIVLTGAGRPGQPATAATRLVQADIVVDVQTAPIPNQTINVYSAFQQFERGFMIWRSDIGSVTVFYGTGNGNYSFFSATSFGNLPDNPYGNPPSGLVRPINGFGRVWGNFSAVRNGLGWATNSEQGYNSTIVISQGAPISFTLPNGSIAHTTPSGTWTF